MVAYLPNKGVLLVPGFVYIFIVTFFLNLHEPFSQKIDVLLDSISFWMTLPVTFPVSRSLVQLILIELLLCNVTTGLQTFLVTEYFYIAVLILLLECEYFFHHWGQDYHQLRNLRFRNCFLLFLSCFDSGFNGMSNHAILRVNYYFKSPLAGWFCRGCIIKLFNRKELCLDLNWSSV